MSEITFEEVKVPVRANVGRTAAPNPYADTVRALGTDSRKAEQARAFVLKSETKEAHDKDVNRTRRQIQEAAAKLGCTAGVEVTPGKDGKSSKVTFWTQPKISRKPKDEEPSA